MRPHEIAHRRLLHQQINGPAAKEPAEVVAALGAVQAQDFSGALWAVGLRLPQATEASIRQAIADRAIVRTWPMRGTLHFVAAADVRWMLALLTPRVLAGATRRHPQLELDETIYRRCEHLVTRALEGGQVLTREAVYACWEQAGVSTAGQRGYHLLWWLAQRGVLCFGPPAGKHPTFTLLDEWVPSTPPLEREAALAELARRYFGGHGPATLADLVWWSGLKVAEARMAVALAAPHLVKQTVAGTDYWMSSDSPALPVAAADLHLLPSFDEYLLGYADRSAVLDPSHTVRINPGSNGVFKPILVRDGRVAGTWRRTLRTHAVSVTIDPFQPLPPGETEALAQATARYARFVGKPVALPT
jgi:hypothetical protein